MKKSIIITVSNHKGGVGKTTTAITVATGLAAMGYPVVLVDCDSQGSIAQFLDLAQRPALYELVVMQRPRPRCCSGSRLTPSLGVITGDADTLEIEDALFPRAASQNRHRHSGRPAALPLGGQTHLHHRRHRPQPVQHPGQRPQCGRLGAYPGQPEYAAEAGIEAMSRAVADLQRMGGRLNLLGVLPTLVDFRSREHKQTIADLRRRSQPGPAAGPPPDCPGRGPPPGPADLETTPPTPPRITPPCWAAFWSGWASERPKRQAGEVVR